MQYDYILVLITVPSKKVGQDIATLLVEKRLAACVNMIPGITSIYHWQEAVEQDEELLLMAKTKSAHFEYLAHIIQEFHPYAVPEVIAIPILAGLNEYLAWIDAETT